MHIWWLVRKCSFGWKCEFLPRKLYCGRYLSVSQLHMCTGDKTFPQRMYIFVHYYSKVKVENKFRKVWKCILPIARQFSQYIYVCVCDKYMNTYIHDRVRGKVRIIIVILVFTHGLNKILPITFEVVKKWHHPKNQQISALLISYSFKCYHFLSNFAINFKFLRAAGGFWYPVFKYFFLRSFDRYLHLEKYFFLLKP